MRSIKTKLFSLAMAVSMVLALAGCAMSAPSTVGSIGGVEIPAGIYLLAQYNSYNTASGVAELATGETASDVKAVLKATCTGTIGDEEVTATGRYLFITPTLLQGINDMDTTKSKKVLEGFEQVIKVPQRRFYTAIKQLSGKTGEEAGGYTKATGAANINFAIVQKDALIQYTKHAAPKIIAPENNPDADAYVFGYRMVGIAKAYKNMLSGMYFSHDKA